MKLLLALLALLVSGAAAPRPPCPQPAAHQCAIGNLSELKVRGDLVTTERTIRIAPSALPLERPLSLRFAGMASGEFYWNGHLIGRNGLPGDSRASEIPGLYFASFTIPSRLVRPGDNRVSVRLSGQHLWLPVERPIHILDIGPYETPELPDRTHYLPALLALGAIAAAFAYFLVAVLGGGARGSRLIAAFAFVALLQLLAEVSRAFIAYSYPWALARVTAIALLSGVASVIVAAYSQQRFLGHRLRWLAPVTGLLAAAIVLFVPWFDFKAMGALLAGTLALGVAGIAGARRRAAGARWALAASVMSLLVMGWQGAAFLDTGWHLIAASLLVLLVLEQFGQLRAARAEAARAASLEERLREAERRGEPIVQLRYGNRVHRVAQADIVYARGADDYCEVRLADGRTLLVTMGLARLQASLQPNFRRVHKSYVVNGDHVRQVQPRPGGGRLVALGDGITIPVGRSYSKGLAEWSG